MALIVKSNGEAAVDETTTNTAAAATTATNDNSNVEIAKTATPSTSASSADTTSAASNTKTSGTSVPDTATAGLDFKTIQQSLNTTYDSKYDEQLADLYNQIVQRKPFSYSTDEDMLYQNYLQKYTQQGKQAMRDTMGQAAALTGGYGSSYGQAVGQQQYDAYLQELNDLIPELYDRAYQQYAAEGDRLTQQYSLLSDMDDRARTIWQTNYNVNADNYDRYMEEAALAGAAGDFSKYEDVFGADAVAKMQQTYNLDRLLPYLEAGLINKDQFNQLLAPILSELGIVTSQASGGGSGDPWGYGGAGWNPGYMSGTSGDAGSKTSGVGYTGVYNGENVLYQDPADTLASLLK